MEQMSYRFEWDFDDEDESKPFLGEKEAALFSSLLEKWYKYHRSYDN